LGWARRGSLPFKVIDERQAARYARDYQHIVIDTSARPDRADLQALAEGCDIMIVPTTPDALALDALMQTVQDLRTLNTGMYRILLTRVPPRPSRDGDEARAMLAAQGLPLFKHSIRRLVAFEKAALAGVPVYDADDPRAREAWAEYEAIGRELMESKQQ
jgi:chromosome partitioning protein